MFGKNEKELDLKCHIITIIKRCEKVSLISDIDDSLVGCFGLNDSLRQYFSLYRAVCQREGN